MLKKLVEKGFVELQPGNPTLFRALEPIEVVGKIQKDVLGRIREFVTLVEKVKVEKRKRVQHVWVSRGRWAVESRVRELINGAERELLLFLIASGKSVKLEIPEIPNPEIARVLLYEKFSAPIESFRLIDREKLAMAGGFFRRFIELLDGYTLKGVEFKPVFLGIADGEKSIIAFKEGEELVAVSITIPMIVLLQKIMFESLWEEFTSLSP